MYRNRNSLGLILLISLFAVLGCNLGNQGGADTTNEMPKAGSSPSDSTDADETVNSETTIPDLDFPEDSGDAKETPEKTGGDKTTVVKFGKEKSSRSYKDSVVRSEKHTYSLKAGKGQTMSLSIRSVENNAVFRIRTPDGKYLGKGTDEEGVKVYNGALASSGNYKIIVTPTRGNATYTMNFGVSGKSATDKDDNSATIESRGGLTTVVKFKKGGTSATYKNAVIRGERNKYLLGASAGQVMSVNISSVENNAVFDIQSPSGKTVESEIRNWSGQLSEKGRYRIIVGGTRGNSTYTIRFAVR